MRKLVNYSVMATLFSIAIVSEIVIPIGYFIFIRGLFAELNYTWDRIACYDFFHIVPTVLLFIEYFAGDIGLS